MTIYQVTKDACIPQLLIWPGLMSAAAIVVLVLAFFRIPKMSKDWAVRIPLGIFIAVAMIFFLSTQIHLLRRGVYLPTESQEEIVTGTVQPVERDPGSPRFSLGNGEIPSYAHLVNVDGATYYCLTSEGISPGSLVELRYLPRSGVVLSCTVIGGDKKSG